jgi:thymidylate kinase
MKTPLTMQKIDYKLIVIDGRDGIGKTTQSKMLCEWFNSFKKGYQLNYVKELNESSFMFKAVRDLVYNLYNVIPTNYLADLIKINRYLVYDYITQDRGLDFNLDFNNTLYLIDRWNISTYCYLIADGYANLALSYLTDKHTVIPGLTILLVGDKGKQRMLNRKTTHDKESCTNNNMFEDKQDSFNDLLSEAYTNFDVSLYPSKVVKINNDELTKQETQLLIRKVVTEYLDSVEEF